MQEQVKVGEVITGSARRDAIHVAVAPVVAGERLCAGMHVLLDGHGVAFMDDSMGNGAELVGERTDRTVGVVDPFLTESVKKGDRFYVFLYPNTVTGMRHHWMHPAFKEVDR